MFPLQRGNELVIQFSNALQPQHKISKDLILDHHNTDNSPLVAYSDKEVRTSRPNQLFYAPETSHANSAEEEYAKKMVHREIERQRRQEMATLHASLRSLLPLPFIRVRQLIIHICIYISTFPFLFLFLIVYVLVRVISIIVILLEFQGKRSMSDQMNEAVNYINHLQKNIKELSEKRDKLKKKVAINSSLESRENKHESCGFTVRQNSSGAVGIEISGLSEEGVSLSKLLELLLEEGLEVFCCLSTKVDGRLLHSLQCEVCTHSCLSLQCYTFFFLLKSMHILIFYVSLLLLVKCVHSQVVNSDTVDLSELRRKFSNVVPSFRVSE